MNPLGEQQESEVLFGGHRQKERLFAELDRTDLSRHLAFFYEDSEAQMDVATIYLCYGLMTGRRAVYFFESSDPARIEESLREAGIDVDERLADGDLVFADATETYVEPEFDADGMISTLEREAIQSVEDGYEGLCVAGENTWCFHADASFEEILDFESDFDAVCPDLPVVALCQYDLNRFDREAAAKALWTHDQLIYQYTLCDNPYYVPPSQYTAGDDTALDAKLMLEQTHELARTQRQLSRREQRLEVVSRVLRHNIRNDLNVVSGNIELVREGDALSDQDRARLEQAIDHVNQVCDIAEKSRYVQRTLEQTAMSSFTVGPLLERVTEAVRAANPDVDISVQGELGQTIGVSEAFGEALVHLLLDVVRNYNGASPVIEITCEPVPPENVCISIETDQRLIPATDREVLRLGTETQLKHGTGLDLWLVKWIIESGYGTLEFPENESRLRINCKRGAG
ncbi:MEDS domain-containing protein [Halovenus halobia]|uniref:MEDS domain-containing protein n=1 Tax=Halovenus halobia TaxID=3396622 RepID=UPI003F566750